MECLVRHLPMTQRTATPLPGGRGAKEPCLLQLHGGAAGVVSRALDVIRNVVYHVTLVAHQRRQILRGGAAPADASGRLRLCQPEEMQTPAKPRGTLQAPSPQPPAQQPLAQR